MSVRPEEVLRSRALSVAGVTALIGSRWFPNAAPQRTAYPLVVCDVEEEKQSGHLTGGGWAITRLAVRIYAVETAASKGYDICQNVAEQLRFALGPFKGNITVSGETVLPTIFFKGQLDTPAGIVDGSDKPVYGITQNYTVSMAQATS